MSSSQSHGICKSLDHSALEKGLCPTLQVATESLSNRDKVCLLAVVGSLAAAPGGSRGTVRRREQVDWGIVVIDWPEAGHWGATLVGVS